MKRLRFLVVLAALSGCASTTPTAGFTDDVEFESDETVTDLPASDAVLRAEAALVEGRLRDAHALLEAAVTATPNDARALFDLALVLELGDDLDGAERRYREVIAMHPAFAEALNNLGLLLHDRERYDEARGLLERAIAARPGYGEAHGNLGLVLEALDDLEGAIGRYRAATRLLPNDGLQHANLGFALLTAGRRDEARVSLLRARRLAEGDDVLLREVAVGLRNVGEGADALRVFEALIAEEDDAATRAELHVEAGLCAAVIDRGDVAERHARAATELAPRHAGAFILLGRLARARGDAPAARAAFQTALDVAPADSPLRRDASEALLGLR